MHMRKFFALFLSLLLIAMSALIPMTLAATGPNLVPNPSLEENTSGKPHSWSSNNWGTNTASFSYTSSGSHTGTYSATTKISAYTSGDAKWSFAPVSVTPNTTYTFSDWYKSTTTSTVDVEVLTTDNQHLYLWLGDLAPTNSSWKEAAYSFKTPANASKLTMYHSISSVGEITVDDYSLNTTVTTAPSAPTVSITTPAPNATVSATTLLEANAADTAGISSVQFKIDGTNLGTSDTTAPYSVSWDTKAVSDGLHDITAVATNTSGLSTVSSPVSLNVQNASSPEPTTPLPTTNLIANESLESGSTTPAAWSSNSWGANSANLTYENTGRTESRSVKATLSSRTDGDAKWLHNSVPVTAGKTYTYSNWYTSNVATELDAMVTMDNGSVQFYWLGSFPASPDAWQKAAAQFTVPAGAASLTIFQVISTVGYVQTDDYYLSENQPRAFNRALVSITFDDGWRSIHANGLPLLKKYGLVSTQYLNSQPVIGGWPDYMTYQMIKEFTANGHELGWHTRSHADITKLSSTALNTELTIPTAFLSGTGQPASAYKNFASPYGAYNTASIASVKKKYRSHRSTDVGYNTRDNLTPDNIKVQNITDATTPAQVQTWVNQAIADKSWLVLVYHEVDTNPADSTYAVTPTHLDQELALIKQSGVTVKTVQQALDELVPQL